jgi:aminopeptidase C
MVAQVTVRNASCSSLDLLDTAKSMNRKKSGKCWLSTLLILRCIHNVIVIG